MTPAGIARWRGQDTWNSADQVKQDLLAVQLTTTPAPSAIERLDSAVDGSQAGLTRGVGWEHDDSCLERAWNEGE
jgi:hypothetical protein